MWIVTTKTVSKHPKHHPLYEMDPNRGLCFVFNSAGFYELSDGGSCSLSNSCTSVFSESISSSNASLLPSSQHPKTCLGISDYRPKSADEPTVRNQSQKQGIYSNDGCQIKAYADISGTTTRPKPRPVSTGNYSHIIMKLG